MGFLDWSICAPMSKALDAAVVFFPGGAAPPSLTGLGFGFCSLDAISHSTSFSLRS